MQKLAQSNSTVLDASTHLYKRVRPLIGSRIYLTNIKLKLDFSIRQEIGSSRNNDASGLVVAEEEVVVVGVVLVLLRLRDMLYDDF